mmetsp:Transcript_7140/g.15452  ORF Transcript_7140/g.15452 Transcript_7140/m.15452 type:complete len:333 (+) Transcript_7140:346-1344(+)
MLRELCQNAFPESGTAAFSPVWPLRIDASAVSNDVCLHRSLSAPDSADKVILASPEEGRTVPVVRHRSVGHSSDLNRSVVAHGQGLLLRLIEAVNSVDIGDVDCAFRQRLVPLNHHLCLLAVARKVVVVLHLAAVSGEGLGVVAHGAATETLDPLRPPLRCPSSRFLHVRTGQRKGGGLQRHVTPWKLPLLHVWHGTDIRSAYYGVVVLPCVEDVSPAPAGGIVRAVAEYSGRLATDHRHLQVVVLGQGDDLVLPAPVHVVLYPVRVLLHTVHPQQKSSGSRVRIVQSILGADLPEFPRLGLAARILATIGKIGQRVEEATVIIGHCPPNGD